MLEIFFRELAVESDSITGDDFYDARYDARNRAGRPLWAQGAFILVSSHKIPFIKRLLDDVALPYDCRYLVLETKRLHQMQQAMADNTCLCHGNRELLRVKAVINKLRVLTLTDENRDRLVSFSSNLVTEGIAIRYMQGDDSDSEFEAPPRALMDDDKVKVMHRFIQESSPPLMKHLGRQVTFPTWTDPVNSGSSNDSDDGSKPSASTLVQAKQQSQWQQGHAHAGWKDHQPNQWWQNRGWHDDLPWQTPSGSWTWRG